MWAELEMHCPHTPISQQSCLVKQHPKSGPKPRHRELALAFCWSRKKGGGIGVMTPMPPSSPSFYLPLQGIINEVGQRCGRQPYHVIGAAIK